MAEMTQVSELPALVEARRDRSPELVALGSFFAVILLGVGLILIEFQLPSDAFKIAPWVIAIAIAAYVRWSVPSARLTPDRRALRDDRRAGSILGFLSACTVIAAVTAATYLTSWSQWLVLASLVMLTFGVGLMLHVRFTIGP